MEVKLKRTEQMQVATISHVGQYGEVGKLYEEIIKWLNQKQLQIAGPPFGWFHDNPKERARASTQTEMRSRVPIQR